MFRQADIPKRLIPATLAFSAFTITMDALPGTPQIQNIIPTTFFRTDAYAAPWLGVISAAFTTVCCFLYLEWQRRQATAQGEGYGTGHSNEPEAVADNEPMHAWLAALPLLIVGLGNRALLQLINDTYAQKVVAVLDPNAPTAAITQDLKANAALWAVEGALLLGIVATLVIGWPRIRHRLAEASKVAVAGSLLASMNTASEYGFGAVIAALPGFRHMADLLMSVRDPLLNQAITVNVLSGLTGSASGGLSLTLGAFADRFISAANAEGIPLEVMHRVASLASGGMDTLPHNGAVITLLAVTGMTHKQAYKDIFVITIIKTVTVFFAIAVYSVTGVF
jgi:H+/gluconate symporter-like permease